MKWINTAHKSSQKPITKEMMPVAKTAFVYCLAFVHDCACSNPYLAPLFYS